MSQEPSDTQNSTDTTCPTCGRDDFASVRGMKAHHARAHGESIAGVEIECAACGDSFTVDPGDADSRETCSVECKAVHQATGPVDVIEDGRPLAERECVICGDPFTVAPAKVGVIKTCGRDACYREAQHRANAGENNALWNGGPVTLECPECGDEFDVKPSHADIRVTCGRDACYRANMSKTMSGENNPLWDRVELECEACGDAFYAKRANADWRKTCSHECYGEYRSQTYHGPANPSWKGGISRSLYLGLRDALDDREWGEIAGAVRERDGHECQLCGGDAVDGPAFNAHHIIPVLAGGTNADELLLTLCNECHMRVEAYTWALPEVESLLDI